MAEPKIGAGIICRDSARTIVDCIESLAGAIDFLSIVDTGSKDNTVNLIRKTCRKSKIPFKLSFMNWVDNFAAARNFAFSFLPFDCDWLFWCDSDDVVWQAERMHYLCKNAPQEISSIWFPYHYAVDEYGNPFTVFIRERLLRRANQWIWRDRLHETIQPLSPAKWMPSEDVIIRHNHIQSDVRNDRNMRILQLMMKENPEDRRVWLYFGHQHFAGRNFKEAAQWYLKFGTDPKGADLERYQALCFASKCFRELNDAQAVDVGMMGIILFPQFKDAYLEVAHSYRAIGDFDKAIHWAKMSEQKEVIKEPPPLIFINPLEYGFNRHCLLAECYSRKGDYDTAMAELNEAFKIRPNDEIRGKLSELKTMATRRRLVDGVKMMTVHILETGDIERLRDVQKAVPFWFKDIDEYRELIGGTERYLANAEKVYADVVIPGENNSVLVYLETVKDPKTLLEKVDKEYKHITAICNFPSGGKQVVRVMGQTDMEELLMSSPGRHILNLQRTPDQVIGEYDFNEPKDLLVRIFCGQGLEGWNPRTIKEIGCGGSETAAAWVAKELAGMSCQPFIYAMDTQVWDGVIYREHTKFRPEIAGGHLFISSRVPEVFNQKIPALQKWLWFHDIHRWDRFTPEIASEINALVVLSKWHANFTKNTYPFLKDAEVIDFDNNPLTFEDNEAPNKWYENDKCNRLPVIAIIGDGADMERFKIISEKRIPHRFIWLSSADRGLEELLKLWPKLKERLPDAELKIFYGWEYYDNYLHIKEMREFKERILQLVKQSGIEWCGRVGQNQIALELMKADALIYPPPHQFRETYGIAFLEAQAAGCLCFYRQNGALGETIGDRGIPLALNLTEGEIVDKVVETLHNTELCNTIRVVGREYAMQRTWRRQTEKMLTLYRRLENEPHRSD